MPKRVVVIQESDSGRNQQFKDNLKNKILSRSDFVKEIEKGNYQNYHVRVINGVKTPVSNPDNSTNNNLD